MLSDKVLANVQTPRANTPRRAGADAQVPRAADESASYGLGWRIYDYAGHKVVGHHGGVTGYRSLIMFDPGAE